MLQPIDFYRAAKTMRDKYGAAALERATLRAKALGDEGDEAGRERWSTVARVIGEMQVKAGAAGHAA